MASASNPVRIGGRERIRVVICDDHALFRRGLMVTLESADDIDVVGEAANGAEAIELVSHVAPDVVLMDVRMPGTNGIEATARITEALSDTRVLILTTFDLDSYAFAGLRAGASGFLLKDTRPAELVEAIRTVHRGDAVVSPRVTRRMLEMFAGKLPDGDGDGAGPAREASHAVEDLTPREREVLLAIASGLSNAEIAAHLTVSEATVKTHVGKVLGKLGLRDRVQAVIFAYESGLVRP